MQRQRIFLTGPSFPFLTLAAFMSLLWFAGGASRGDVLGQVIVRVGAWSIIAIYILRVKRVDFDSIRPVVLLFLAAVLVPIGQAIPVHVDSWSRLTDFDITLLTEIPSGLQPSTMVPSATLNAIFALSVPAALLLNIAQADDRDRSNILSLLLIFIISAGLLGLVQFSGLDVDSPFINDVPGSVGSVFANRNHFSLLLSMGCILTSVWALLDRNAIYWRGPMAACLVLLFSLMVVAIGSRSGLMLLAIALLLSTLFVGKHAKRRLRGSPAWVFPSLVLTVLVVIAGFIGLSVFADRVESIDRLFSLDIDEDLRIRSRATILEAIRNFLPFGAGLGSFDSIFRLHEPTTLLAIQYFNQAHNDYLGIALDAGLPGLAVLGAAIAWWAHATNRVFRADNGKEVMLARLGSALLMMILLASVTDYPARTPIIMAVIVIAAAWLAHGSHVCRGLRRSSTLPEPVSDV